MVSPKRRDELIQLFEAIAVNKGRTTVSRSQAMEVAQLLKELCDLEKVAMSVSQKVDRLENALVRSYKSQQSDT